MNYSNSLIILGLLCGAVACSDSDAGSIGDGDASVTTPTPDAGTSEPGPADDVDAEAPTGTPSGDSTSTEISADEGGEVALGDASLSIPAGALSGDTTVTVETLAPSSDLPELDTVQGEVYDFGPDGTEFSEPVELTLPVEGEPAEGEEAVVSWLNTESGEWEDLPTVVDADGTVTAEVTHFTLFVVRFRGAPAVDCSFDTECDGGDPTGTWTIGGFCFDNKSPFSEACSSSTVEIEADITGEISINDDGTYSSQLDIAAGSLTFVVPADCTGDLMLTDCANLTDDIDADCTGSVDDGCRCSVPIEAKVKTEEGTWEADGNQLSLDNGEEVKTHTFCASGSTLKVQETKENGDVSTWSGTK